ncbi:integrase [Bradyrhizobium sp. GM24.11]
MALRMVALNRAADGRWFARKGIPEDVREPYARLYGVKREAHLKLPANTSRPEAKVRLGEWAAEVETRIATLRATAKGEGQPLTKLNAIALAGRWYLWFVGQHENDPGKPQHWKKLIDTLLWDVLRPEAPDEYENDPKSDPDWDWAKEPEVRAAVRPRIAEQARVASFLANEGLALNPSAHDLLVDAVSDNLLPALTLLERRARGDYSPDTTPETFPVFNGLRENNAQGPGCWALFEAYVKTGRLADDTVTRWRAVFLRMQRDLGHTGANGITEDAARAWVQGLITEERSAETVREVWLAASRSVFSWAVRHKHISRNPFADIKVDVPKRSRNRETKAFRNEEVRTILKAALTYTDRTARDRARRWVPWICAYSGARAGEITQLRGVDVEKRGAFYTMKLTPEAGTIKTRQTRIVPIHEHIIAQGFLDMVRRVGRGALFYNPEKTSRADTDIMKPRRSRAATARAHLSSWVRELGITDPEVSPTHAWRHTFKQRAARCGIAENVHDEITGHAPASEGRKYTVPTVEDMAAALKKFPRYDVEEVRPRGKKTFTTKR